MCASGGLLTSGTRLVNTTHHNPELDDLLIGGGKVHDSICPPLGVGSIMNDKLEREKGEVDKERWVRRTE